MNWGFSRKIKVLPGIHLNLSKRGISATIGIPGASVNVGRNGIFRNLGLPGTGLYSRKKIDYDSKSLSNEQFDNNIEDKTAHAQYFIGQMTLQMDGLKRMYDDEMITAEEFNKKCDSLIKDPRYLEIRNFLESEALNSDETETSDKNSPSSEYPIWFKIIGIILALIILVFTYLHILKY